MKENVKIEKALRLQVFLAHAGIASRRSSERFITEGRVSVNGEIVRTLGAKVLPGDTVSFDGMPVKLETCFRYIALNKPPGYICSSFDPENRPLALDLLPAGIRERLYSVGRLDFLSSGLIIFTNDGDFAAKLSHPGAGIEKEYQVETSGPIPDSLCDAFSAGVTVEGVNYKAIKVEKTGGKTALICLVEGKNREIRRVFSHFHLHPVLLRRVRIGPVLLGNLAEGKNRSLTNQELAGLGREGTQPSVRSKSW